MTTGRQFAVYILASRRNGTLYIGVTSDLAKRVWEHKQGFVQGFTREHGVETLVWFELHDSAESAITREKQLKKWNRAWKVRLIEEANPYWNDLYSTFTA
jgi:putative endonuclease